MTSLIDKALSCVGLMRVAEHGRKVEVLVDLLDETRAAEKLYADKFKKAVTDLEKRDREVAELKGECVELRRSLRQRTNDLDHIEGQEELSERLIAELRDEIASLRPDALLWRNARDKRAGKRGKANG